VATTNSFALTMAYDDMKVAAILNEIRGFDHAGATFIGVPTVFGMNFQAVSVGQKLKVEQVLTAPLHTGGYLNAAGAPSEGLQATLEHTDRCIGAMVDELAAQGLLDSTMIIISAKHANSPGDLSSLVRVNPAAISGIVNTIAPHHLSADTGPMIWLKGQTTPEQQQANTERVVAALTDSMVNGGNPARIARILSGADLTALFQDPLTDPRTPDIILVPQPGTVYTTSGSKIADHGGFGDEDVHVGLLVSQPSISSKTINDQVETRQIACTILKALALSCDDLMSQQLEPSKFLPHSNHDRSGDTRGVTSVKPKR
jgi:arylsulfatase A-like enzyme